LATLPAPTRGGEFRGVNTLGQTMLGFACMVLGWGLTVFGFGLGIAGLMQQGETTKATQAGLALNLLAAGAGVMWFLIANP
jgi:hypothetical protein